MKTKLKSILIALILLLVPAVLTVSGFVLPPVYSDTFMGELSCKVRLLEETPSPRIILLGGSAVAFGVDSTLMERELTGFHVVNFGMYAAIGTTVMLDLSESHLREGDIVIVIPEQSSQTLSDSFDPSVMWQGLDGASGLLADLPLDKLGKLMGAFPSFAAGKLGYILSASRPEPTGVYRRSSFNGHGDISVPCMQNEMPDGFDASTLIVFDTALPDEAFSTRLNCYAAVAREKGAAVWYAFCPMNALAVKGEGEPDDFCSSLYTALEVPIIGNPNDSVMDAAWFYDTNFHLNSSGKIVYTRQLTGAIKAMLGDPSPVHIELPQMPTLAHLPAFRGDDSDAACFLYDGSAVVGLTEEGLDRERLVIPSTHEGEAVLSISRGAFSSAAHLRELTVHPNIRTVSDGAFSGCDSLERILFTNDVPSNCRVGQALLEGSRAKLYVPGAAISAYRTDYFWSVYSQSLLPLAADGESFVSNDS